MQYANHRINLRILESLKPSAKSHDMTIHNLEDHPKNVVHGSLPCLCTGCAVGKFGDGCLQNCTCVNGGVCNFKNGSCDCPAGYAGSHCEQRKIDLST